MGTFETYLKCRLFLDVIMMFPKTNQCNQDVLKMTKCDQNVPTNHMVETF